MLPQLFIERTRPLLGLEWDAFAASLNENAPVSIRLNDKLTGLFPHSTEVPWCPAGRYLPERPPFTSDPLFHGGTYYVQEASSMFLWQALSQCVSTDATVLDLCAAPGGKSTLAAQYLHDGLLVSNEPVRQRANILSENIRKWGTSNTLVCNNHATDFGALGACFDALLTDVPCSGEGMFRKDAGAISDWSLANIRMCVARQRQILTDAWPALKPNGILVYSTCTYNQEENEENIQWLIDELGAEYVPLDIPAEWKITSWDKGYRFFPHKTRGEGLFMAVLRKTAPAASLSQKQTKQPQKTPALPAEIKSWLLNDDFSFIQHGNLLRAYPTHHSRLMEHLASRLHILSAGIEIAGQKGKNLIPQQGLALSKHLNTQAFPIAALSISEALAYLRGETLYLPDLPDGYVLITCQTVPIGWGKNLGTRCNNLYPNEWRIRKQ